VNIDITDAVPADSMPDLTPILDAAAEEIIQALGVRHSPAYIRLAKWIAVNMVNLSSEAAYTIEQYEAANTPEAAAVARKSFQGNYKDVKDKTFQEIGVQIMLSKQLHAKISSEMVLIQTISKGEELPGTLEMRSIKSSGVELGHVFQVAPILFNFSSASELVADLMVEQLTTPILKAAYRCIERNPGDYMSQNLNDDHGFLTRTEPEMLQTIYLRKISLVGDMFSQLLTDPASQAYIKRLLRGPMDGEGIPVGLLETMKNDILQANTEVLLWVQQLILGATVIKQENAAGGSLTRKAKPSENSAYAARRVKSAFGGVNHVEHYHKSVASEYLAGLLHLDVDRLEASEEFQDLHTFEEQVSEFIEEDQIQKDISLISLAFKFRAPTTQNRRDEEAEKAEEDLGLDFKDRLKKVLENIEEKLTENQENERMRMSMGKALPQNIPAVQAAVIHLAKSSVDIIQGAISVRRFQKSVSGLNFLTPRVPSPSSQNSNFSQGTVYNSQQERESNDVRRRFKEESEAAEIARDEAIKEAQRTYLLKVEAAEKERKEKSSASKTKGKERLAVAMSQFSKARIKRSGSSSAATSHHP